VVAAINVALCIGRRQSCELSVEQIKDNLVELLAVHG